MDRSNADQELDQAHRLKEVIEEVRNRPFIATSPDGFIKVSAVASGQVVALEISPKIYRNPNSASLARMILETINQAIAGAAEMHIASLEQVVGTGAGTFQQLMQGTTDLINELLDESDDFRRRS